MPNNRHEEPSPEERYYAELLREKIDSDTCDQEGFDLVTKLEQAAYKRRTFKPGDGLRKFIRRKPS